MLCGFAQHPFLSTDSSMKTEKKITFQPSGRTVYVLPGTSVFEAAARAGLLLQTPCGGQGKCGKCKVYVRSGTCPSAAPCVEFFSKEELAKGARLGCQAQVTDDCVIEIPAESLFETQSRILTDSDEQEVDLEPAIWKKYVELPPPDFGDDISDAKRLEREIGPVRVRLDVLRALPESLRCGDFKGTAVVCECNRELVSFEPGDTSNTVYGAAVDLGSTTIVVSLLNLGTGSVIDVSAAMNPQVSRGDDVISRINQSREKPGSVAEMQNDVAKTVNDLLADLAGKHGIEVESIYEVTLAGNTTMQHLFCGISPAALGEVPFPSVFNRALFLRACDVGLRIHPNGCLYVFANIGGFVGGDTVAGILACGLHREDGTRILIDIGTNGEIVLAHEGRLLCTSTAAGPAFEGARIAAGMRATDGAIEKVVCEEGDIAYNVIGNTKPSGICGTALIDVAAAMLQLGVLDTTGRILSRDELDGTVADALAARLAPQEDGSVSFVLADAESSRTGQPICIQQKDIRELQLAAGAIRAGISIMMRQAGLSVEDIDEVLLAGGFGNFIRRSNARRIGILPQMPVSKVRFVGNAASMGARLVLLSRPHRREADEIAESATHIDLSMDPEFQFEFSSAMLFPEDTFGA